MRTIILMFLFIPTFCLAELNQPKAKGFHWYSIEDEEQEAVIKQSVKPQSSESLEPYDELLKIRRETQNKLAESLLRPSYESTKSYIEAQTAMARRHQEFVRHWQRVLLANPELDHRLHFPTDNSAIATKNDEEKSLMDDLLKSGSKQFGLIFIYQGNSSLSQRFASVLLPFVDNYQFSMIPVSVNNESLAQLPHSKHIPIDVLRQKIPVKSRYLPAVMLVNLKTEELTPLSYGFVALTDLKARFLDVVTDFKRFSYEGLGV